MKRSEMINRLIGHFGTNSEFCDESRSTLKNMAEIALRCVETFGMTPPPTTREEYYNNKLIKVECLEWDEE